MLLPQILALTGVGLLGYGGCLLEVLPVSCKPPTGCAVVRKLNYPVPAGRVATKDSGGRCSLPASISALLLSRPAGLPAFPSPVKSVSLVPPSASLSAAGFHSPGQRQRGQRGRPFDDCPSQRQHHQMRRRTSAKKPVRRIRQKTYIHLRQH